MVTLRFLFGFFLFILLFNPLYGQNPLIQDMISSVNKDSLFSTINKLQSFKTRFEFTSGQDSAAEFIYNKFRQWNLTTESDWYNIAYQNLYEISVIDQKYIWICGSGTSLLYSSNAGLNWAVKKLPSGQGFYSIHFVNQNKGWATSFKGSIFHTSDGGNTWIEQYTNSSVQYNKIDFYDEKFGVSFNSNGIFFRTTNGGLSWDNLNLNTQYPINDFAVVDSSRILVVSSSGSLLLSTDKGNTWNSSYSSSSYELRCIFFHDQKIGWVLGAAGQILITRDGGISWIRDSSTTELNLSILKACYIDTLIGCALNANSIQRTTDGGVTWSIVLPAKSSKEYFQAIKAITKENLIAICTKSLIYMSNDAGLTWISQMDVAPPEYLHKSRNIVATIPGTITPEKEIIAVAHYDSYSDDPINLAPGADDNASGTSAVIELARILKSFQFKSTIKLVAVSGEELGLLGSAHYASEAKKMKKNIIGAINADMIGYSSSTEYYNLMLQAYNGDSSLFGIVKKCNSNYSIGLNIQTKANGTANSDHASFTGNGYNAVLLIENNTSGSNSYYHKQNDLMEFLSPVLLTKSASLMLASVAELAEPLPKINQDIPTGFSLEQNYPNPFNPSTTFKFSIPEIAHVTLKVFNILGSEVATIADSKFNAGTYTISWNASSLSSGVYFYKIKAGKYSDSKKLILVK
jgi:photosystem II stability/assembly factor-like uncharacterized protein